MSFDKIILWMAAIGALIGAADWILGNRFGLGEKFEDGFKAMGPLALGMVGMYCLAPLIAEGLKPVVTPLVHLIGADPAVAGSVLAVDMGGYPLSTKLAEVEEAGIYAGAVLASTFGCTLTFNIPVGFNLVEKEDRQYYAKGILLGLTPLPLGCMIAGVISGFPLWTVIINTVPTLLIAVLIGIGLIKIPEPLTKGCMIFGRILTSLIYIGLACAAFENLTGIVIIPGMAPVMDGMEAVSNSGIVLLGTFPMLSLITKVLNKPISKLGGKVGLDAISIAGIFFTMASVVPVFPMLKDMSKRGIVVTTAWIVSATAVFGAHLGYLAGIDHALILPMVSGQLIAGVLALVLALVFTKDMAKRAIML